MTVRDGKPVIEAVTLMLNVPPNDALAVNLSVWGPDEEVIVTLGEARLTVTAGFAGVGDAVRSKVPTKPFSGVTVIVDEPEAPIPKGPIEAGDAERTKSTTETEPVRHWLGVAEQSTRLKPDGSVTEDGSLGEFTKVTLVDGPATTV